MASNSESKTDASRLLRQLLREKRLSAHLKQADLAQRLGQYQSFVSKYESGERRLDVIELRTVCEALGTTVETLLSDMDKRQKGARRAPRS
jgi:transcriptional regulator with XRE-family HTH domain